MQGYFQKYTNQCKFRAPSLTDQYANIFQHFFFFSNLVKSIDIRGLLPPIKSNCSAFFSADSMVNKIYKNLSDNTDLIFGSICWECVG